jgi:hypothetical protein
MSVVLALEDFGSENLGLSKIELSEESLEDSRLKAFEGGYKAGWGDATIALATEQRNLALQVNQLLLDANFTYHEARSQILKSIEPFISELVDKFIPAIAQDSLSLQIRSELLTLVRSQLDGKVIITAPQVACSYLEEILLNESLHQCSFEIDSSQVTGLICIKAGLSEKCFDTEAFIRDVKIKISNFLIDYQRQISNG